MLEIQKQFKTSIFAFCASEIVQYWIGVYFLCRPTHTIVISTQFRTSIDVCASEIEHNWIGVQFLRRPTHTTAAIIGNRIHRFNQKPISGSETYVYDFETCASSRQWILESTSQSTHSTEWLNTSSTARQCCASVC